MTPPGDPLAFYEKNPEYTAALSYYSEKGFPELGFEITELIRNARPSDPQRLIRAGEVRRLWNHTEAGGHRLRGLVAMLELKNNHGRTTCFQVLYTASNDNRYVVRVTQGSFSAKELEAFRKDYDGIPEKGA